MMLMFCLKCGLTYNINGGPIGCDASYLYSQYWKTRFIKGEPYLEKGESLKWTLVVATSHAARHGAHSKAKKTGLPSYIN